MSMNFVFNAELNKQPFYTSSKRQHDYFTRKTAYMLLALNFKHGILSTLFSIRELTDSCDWLVVSWWAEERVFTFPPREHGQFCSIGSQPWMAMASITTIGKIYTVYRKERHIMYILKLNHSPHKLLPAITSFSVFAGTKLILLVYNCYEMQQCFLVCGCVSVCFLMLSVCAVCVGLERHLQGCSSDWTAARLAALQWRGGGGKGEELNRWRGGWKMRKADPEKHR